MKRSKKKVLDCSQLVDVAEQIVSLFSGAGAELDTKKLRIKVTAILQEFALNQSVNAESNDGQEKLTPPQLAKLWGVGSDKVLAWIRSGELRAVNVAKNLGGRPRYIIDRADLEDFARQRSTSVHTRTKSKRRLPGKVIEFF